MANEQSPLAEIDYWRKQAIEFSSQSNDVIIPALARALDLLAEVGKEDPDLIRIERAIGSLDYEGGFSRSNDPSQEPVRVLTYGLLRSIIIAHAPKAERRENIVDVAEEPIQPEAVPDVEMGVRATDPIEGGRSEEEKAGDSNDDSSQSMIVHTGGMKGKVEDEEGGNVKRQLIPKKEESEESSPVVPEDNQRSSVSPSSISNLPDQRRMQANGQTELLCFDDECEFGTRSANAWVQHLKDKHSTTPTLAGLVLRCECGNESFSASHSRRCDISKISIVNQGDGTTIKPRVSKVNPTELECPKCNYRTQSVPAWEWHLREHHSMSAVQAGLILRCECGSDNSTSWHSRTCNISKITIVKK